MASTEDDLFALIAAANVRGVRALLEDQPWLATDRDDDGVSALMRARYQLDRGARGGRAGTRRGARRLRGGCVRRSGSVERAVRDRARARGRHQRRRLHTTAPRGVLRTGRRGSAVARAWRSSRRARPRVDDRHTVERRSGRGAHRDRADAAGDRRRSERAAGTGLHPAALGRARTAIWRPCARSLRPGPTRRS